MEINTECKPTFTVCYAQGYYFISIVLGPPVFIENAMTVLDNDLGVRLTTDKLIADEKVDTVYRLQSRNHYTGEDLIVRYEHVFIVIFYFILQLRGCCISI
jgi:hypothetical protein